MMLRDRLDQLRRIPLAAVLRETGAQRDRSDKAQWHTPQGAISITGMKFMNWHRSRGGGGAIDLVMHLNDLDFKAAVAWIDRHFPIAPDCESLPTPRRLILPPPDPRKLSAVKHYLVHDRAITPSLTDSLIASGKLYADRHGNAVFLMLGQENTTVGAELRGTGPQRWRGMAPGSHKDLGCFSVDAPEATRAILCESAIDAISCCLLHPASLCLSTSGARPNPRWLPALLSLHLTVYCGFDSDATGDTMAEQMIALHPSIRRLRPSQHDWNDVLKSCYA
ncbi:MAG TPA: DUF3991 and TOPRIM domain-containing protein [Candidatus Acidoferrales bacterium]|nr:DUF3991 and TOPRIM domain-containing protein [Candidatus Acidoferrales bacterium]